MSPSSPRPLHPFPNTSFINSVGSDAIGSHFLLSSLKELYMHFDFIHSQETDHQSISYNKKFPAVRQLKKADKKRILVTGGAGFLGSHLVDRLMLMGHKVWVLDNFYTGKKHNIQHWIGHPHFECITHDITEPIDIHIDEIYHLACPASPRHYQYNPVKTLKTNVLGTLNMLELAKKNNAKILLASTSEVYGDPKEHPQRETYWGNVNPVGPRACYDEGKRVAESLAYSYLLQDNLDVRVARIFNTFGPRMDENDGRIASNFIIQALNGCPLTVYGNGTQTRCLQYVHDLIDGLLLLMHSNYKQPVNLGNTVEMSVLEFAEMVSQQLHLETNVILLDSVTDDPQKRRPDTTVALKELGWKPRFSVVQAIQETVDYFREYSKATANKKLKESHDVSML